MRTREAGSSHTSSEYSFDTSLQQAHSTVSNTVLYKYNCTPHAHGDVLYVYGRPTYNRCLLVRICRSDSGFVEFVGVIQQARKRNRS